MSQLLLQFLHTPLELRGAVCRGFVGRRQFAVEVLLCGLKPGFAFFPLLQQGVQLFHELCFSGVPIGNDVFELGAHGFRCFTGFMHLALQLLHLSVPVRRHHGGGRRGRLAGSLPAGL